MSSCFLQIQAFFVCYENKYITITITVIIIISIIIIIIELQYMYREH